MTKNLESGAMTLEQRFTAWIDAKDARIAELEAEVKALKGELCQLKQ